MKLSHVLGLLGILFTAPALAADPHAFTVHDMLAMQRIGDFQVSPDGKQVVFTLRTTDLAANKGRTDLWLVNTDSTSLHQLTSHPDADNSPRWSPDGSQIYFISTRSGSAQVWRIAPTGGEAVQVTKEPLDIDCVLVSPDGKQIAYSMEVFPGTSPADTKKKLDEVAGRKATGHLYDHLFMRHWDTWADGRRSHVFVRAIAGGDAVDVMKAMDADAPTKPFGGADEITFTRDSKSIVFTARDAGRTEAWSTNMDLFVASIDGSGKPSCLTTNNKATDTNPSFSPDGKTLAWLAMSRPGYEADRQVIKLRDWPEGKERSLTENWDRSPKDLEWSADGKTLYTTAQNLGQDSLFAIDVATGKPSELVHEGTVNAPLIAGDRIVYSENDLTHPAELFSCAADGKDIKPITKINADRIAAVKMGEPEQFTFKGWNGDTTYGYIVKPTDFQPTKKYPVAFLIHGGPQGSFGNDFHYRWNPQAYVGAGYAVVMVDFHGSTGYGQKFCDAIRGDWGGKPLEDLKKGLAAALAKYPWMDGKRVAALGASYGGYMINWIAGNWNSQFTCLVCHDGNICERMAYFDTEELWFPEWEHMGTPWDHPEDYEKHNPVNFVKNWKTPMLVIHGGQDFRVVESGGMATFTACQRRNIPSKFLYFPDENHWVTKPANSILWHETVLAWLDQWTK